jgi:hypothetical protein
MLSGVIYSFFCFLGLLVCYELETVDRMVTLSSDDFDFCRLWNIGYTVYNKYNITIAQLFLLVLILLILIAHKFKYKGVAN